MNSRYSRHVSDEQLLGTLDGELSARALSAVKEHIEACWSCRARRERMERAILSLVSWRNQELANYPLPPAGGRQRLERALAAPTRKLGRNSQPESNSISRLVSVTILGLRLLGAALVRNRARYLSAAIAIAMVVLLVPVLKPPVVTAAVLLERVRLARIEETSHGKVIRQRLEIRSGKRVIQKEIVLTRGPRIHADPPAQEADWAPLSLVGSPISWSDPLGADEFRQWRDGLASKNDEVRQQGTSITLSTGPNDDSRIVAASLTVRSSDWHPIAKRVEFRGLPPLEVRELAYEVREAPPESPALTVTQESVPPKALVSRPPIVASGPTSEDLDEAEVSIQELLHTLGADRTGAYQIRRESGVVRFQIFPENSEQHEQLVRALREIPFVEVESSISEAAAAQTTPASESATPPPVYATQPPLAKELWEYSGGLDPANNYLAMLRDAHRSAFSFASALSRLGEQFPMKRWERLSPGRRARIARIVSDTTLALKKASAEYSKALSPALDEMLLRHGIPSTATSESGDDQLPNARCEPWQPAGAAIAADLLHLQDSIRLLFVEYQTERPSTLSADTLLRETAGARVLLQNDLKRLCAPDQTSRQP